MTRNPLLAVGRETAGRDDDHVHVWMMRTGVMSMRAPSRLGSAAMASIVSARRQRESDVMKYGTPRQVGRAFGEPLLGCSALALGTVPVATGILGFRISICAQSPQRADVESS